MSAPQTALILGATGQTGRVLLRDLLASKHFTKVAEYGRRVTPLDDITVGKEKLEQKVIDFEKLDEAGLNSEKWDVVYITLGTTRKIAGSAANFEKIDRDYVVNAARHAKQEGSENSQRLVYLSVYILSLCFTANANSYFLSKGQTEEALAKLGYSDTIIFRPGMLKGADRGEFRLAEEIFGRITGALSHFTSALEIQIPTLSRAIY
ncbi:hypothetical protein BDQ17DRAFT_1352938 [Cyathus striatus]|nr:hypothetical protein BDQ17DRAFT_1352938 [Cyathus striatus]